MAFPPVPGGRLVAIGDTRLHIVERGQGYPVLIFHGGPGLDHTEFGDYLDALGDRYRLILVDERGQGRSDIPPEETWTLERMAHDVTALAHALGYDRYAVLGHSYGSFISLQHAVLYPDAPIQSIVVCGVPDARYLGEVEKHLASFEPEALRDQVAASWAREANVTTQADFASIMHDQMPFHFANPLDPRIAEYEERSKGTVYAPHMLRHFAQQNYGMIAVEDKLGTIAHPTLIVGGRYDRTCIPAAAEAMATAIPGAELLLCEQSGHMPYVEEPELFLTTVRRFLDRHRG